MGGKILPYVLLLVTSSAIKGIQSHPTVFNHEESGITLEFINSPGLVEYNIRRDHDVLTTFQLQKSIAHTEIIETSKGFRLADAEIEILENNPQLFLYRVARNLTKGESAKDCIDLRPDFTNWYGGPENRFQYWPVEKQSFSNYSYVTKETDNCALTERYWLNSKGFFIYVDENVPLFIDQNAPGAVRQICFSAKKEAPYNTTDTKFTFIYYVGISNNSRAAHMVAVDRFLGKPTGIPDERMVRHPIWSTWALYKAAIDEKVVRNFSQDILKYKFNNSQLEIDDDWEVCYGALTFRTSKFPNISELVKSLKASGFRVTLWIHPFINKGCNPWYDEAKQKGYFVQDNAGNPDTQWWNSKTGEAAYVDFTKPAAAKWYNDRLKKLQAETGIDSFKFDAGESSWAPKNPVLLGDRSKSPSLITSAYIRTVAQFGPMVEVRSGQGTQDLPIFVRMIDKDSEWGWNNGLVTLITTLLQMNLVGYPFVLPDMIGGNGYNNHPPNKELFVRWLQANVFMPSLQFSYVPWQYDQETINISLDMTRLHDKYTDLIMQRAKRAVSTGEPINPPLWWIDPKDTIASQIYDQFLLGDDLIAAPVVVPGKTERDIYLPTGRWRDGNNGAIYDGPRWIMDYPAPLKVLPYFVRV